MQLLVIQNGVTRSAMVFQLAPGKIGNAQTVAVILPIIREDVVADLATRRRAEQLTAKCDRSDFDCKVSSIFEYAKAIRYVPDPIETERIADAATTIAENAGDCGDKVILMATLLGSVGILSRLVKVNWYGDLEEHGYDHLFLEAQRPDGSWEAYDPTPENAAAGWEAPAPVREVEAIWGPDVNGFGGLLDSIFKQGAQAGIQLGTQYLGSQIQQGQQQNAQAAQADTIGHQYDTMAHQLQQLLVTFNGYSTLTLEQISQAAAAYDQVNQFAQQYGGAVSYISGQWGRDGPSFRSWIEGLAAKVPLDGTTAAGTTVSGAGGIVNSILGGAIPESSILRSPYLWILLAAGAIWWMKSG